MIAPALARAIVRLLRDRPLAQRLASQGREHALEMFTLDKAIDELDALYTRELTFRPPAAIGCGDRRGGRCISPCGAGGSIGR